MSSLSDTVDIVNITHVDLRWLTYAVRNVQTRDAGESAMRQTLITRFEICLEENPTIQAFAMHFAPKELTLLMTSAQEGRCRTDNERLTRTRMQAVFMGLVGKEGA